MSGVLPISDRLMKKIILSLFIFILASTNSINAQCDTSFTGATILTLEPGMVGCMVGNFSGAVTVRPGAILKMCGNFTMSGSVLELSLIHI